MKKYVVCVIETRSYSVEYIVVAKSRKDAEQKAMCGDTESEQELKLENIDDRSIWEIKREV